MSTETGNLRFELFDWHKCRVFGFVVEENGYKGHHRLYTNSRAQMEFSYRRIQNGTFKLYALKKIPQKHTARTRLPNQRYKEYKLSYSLFVSYYFCLHHQTETQKNLFQATDFCLLEILILANSRRPIKSKSCAWLVDQPMSGHPA